MKSLISILFTENFIMNSSSKSKWVDTQYFRAIDYFASRGEPVQFLNKGAEHALAVLINIFNYSKSEVFLFTSNHKPDVSNNEDYYDAISKHIDDKKKIYCVTLNPVTEETSYRIYKLLYQKSQEFPDLVKLKSADEKFINLVKDNFNGKLYNFAIGDTSLLRIETDIESFKAEGYFYIKDKSDEIKKLKNIVMDFINHE